MDLTYLAQEQGVGEYFSENLVVAVADTLIPVSLHSLGQNPRYFPMEVVEALAQMYPTGQTADILWENYRYRQCNATVESLSTVCVAETKRDTTTGKVATACKTLKH